MQFILSTRIHIYIPEIFVQAHQKYFLVISLSQNTMQRISVARIPFNIAVFVSPIETGPKRNSKIHVCLFGPRFWRCLERALKKQCIASLKNISFKNKNKKKKFYFKKSINQMFSNLIKKKIIKIAIEEFNDKKKFTKFLDNFH